MQRDIITRLSDRPYWFDQGLQFECQRCGVCCTGDPGTVYVNDAEVKAIAEFLGLSLDAFATQYIYAFRDGHSIKEDRDGRCLFHKDGYKDGYKDGCHKGCAIYPIRPSQCRTFPFWSEILRTEKSWHKAALSCKGIGRGRLFSRERILKIVGG